MITFTEAEQQEILNEIANQYFQRNFGALSKSEWETFLFSVYLSHCRKNDALPFDDYTLSKQLGITQSRVRSLKEKVSVKYTDGNFSWKEAFVRAIPNASYFPETHTIKLLIQEKDVLIEVRQLLEARGLFDERPLNDKLLQVPVGSFLEICFSLEKEMPVLQDASRTFLIDLQREYEAEDKSLLTQFFDDFSTHGMKAFAMSASKNVLAEVLESAQDYIPGGNIVKALCNLSGVIKKA